MDKNAVIARNLKVLASRRPGYVPEFDKILTEKQLMFLRKWCIGGSNTTPDALRLFSAIRKRLENAGEYVETHKGPLYRGINLSYKEFLELVDTGILKKRSGAVSWTAGKEKATQYSKGAMVLNPKPIGVVFKQKGSEIEGKILELGKLGSQLGDFFKLGAAFNREIICKDENLTVSQVFEVYPVVSMKTMKAEPPLVRMSKELEKRGLLAKPFDKKVKVAKFTSGGKLTPAKLRSAI